MKIPPKPLRLFLLLISIAAIACFIASVRYQRVAAFAVNGRIAFTSDRDGNDVFLHDIWPSSEEVGRVVEQAVRSEMFQNELDVDETLAQYPVIWTAAGTADSVMPLTYEQLLALTEGVAMPVR